MDNALVDFIEEFAILIDIDTGSPLMSNSENEFHEQVLVHHVRVVAIIAPLLCDLLGHFCLAVEGREHAVDARKQLSVLRLGDCVLIGGVLALEQIPKLG